jgi:preprotein translocase SecE subunit
VARDRQRAKQRRLRRGAQHPAQPGSPGAAPAPDADSSGLHRGNVPGGLDHASGQVDAFDAALVAGSGGEPADDDFAEELEDGSAFEDDAAAAGPPAVVRADRPATTAPGGNRAIAFLRASWAELQRVQWPDRRQVAQATAVVLGFVLVAGAYLGLADALAQRIVDFIL